VTPRGVTSVTGGDGPTPKLNLVMATLFWRTLMVAGAAALLLGASWVTAYTVVGNMLGSPPPDMGVQSTTLLWQGAPELAGHPRVWRFAFSPTRVPGAPSVRIYVTLYGHVMDTEPADLPDRLKVFQRGY